MIEQLVVCVNQNSAGLLIKEDGAFIFNYEPLTAPDDFISLTMPVRAKGYVHSQLPPIFEMHLPEGYLLSLIKSNRQFRRSCLFWRVSKCQFQGYYRIIRFE